MSEVVHPAPHRDRASPLLLIGAASAAPLFWLGQLILGYSVTAQGCYPGDHPVMGRVPPALLLSFDAIAILGALAGGIVSYAAWRRVGREKEGGHAAAVAKGEGRTRFLALWGVYASLGFLIAIIFSAIATLMVTPCAN